ncbi:hypothetical protein [Streptomyces toxytricini]|uniref:hypothetical protein n=1 Tax=Streptomyces toxytricini TaxID=67369 RepID=UPI003444F98E
MCPAQRPLAAGLQPRPTITTRPRSPSSNRAVYLSSHQYSDVWSEATRLGATVTAAPALTEGVGTTLGWAVQSMENHIWHNHDV